jgi:hypothetical protein
VTHVESTPRQRTLARLAAGATSNGRPINNYPVIVIPGGRLSPRLVGHSYYWTTPSGKTIVHHPNAYRWPKLYHGSTLRVYVGEQWLESHPQG